MWQQLFFFLNMNGYHFPLFPLTLIKSVTGARSQLKGKEGRARLLSQGQTPPIPHQYTEYIRFQVRPKMKWKVLWYGAGLSWHSFLLPTIHAINQWPSLRKSLQILKYPRNPCHSRWGPFQHRLTYEKYERLRQTYVLAANVQRMVIKMPTGYRYQLFFFENVISWLQQQSSRLVYTVLEREKKQKQTLTETHNATVLHSNAQENLFWDFRCLHSRVQSATLLDWLKLKAVIMSAFSGPVLNSSAEGVDTTPHSDSKMRKCSLMNHENESVS